MVLPPISGGVECSRGVHSTCFGLGHPGFVLGSSEMTSFFFSFLPFLYLLVPNLSQLYTHRVVFSPTYFVA